MITKDQTTSQTLRSTPYEILMLTGRHDVQLSIIRHLGNSPTISSQPLTSLLGFVCVLQTDTSSSQAYLAVDPTDNVFGRRDFSIAGPTVRNCTAVQCAVYLLTSSEIRSVVLTVLNSFFSLDSFLRQSSSSLAYIYLFDQRIRGFLKQNALHKSTFYLFTYLYLLIYFTMQRKSRYSLHRPIHNVVYRGKFVYSEIKRLNVIQFQRICLYLPAHFASKNAVREV